MNVVVIDIGTTTLKLAYITGENFRDVHTITYNHEQSIYSQIIREIMEFVSGKKLESIVVYSFAEGGVMYSDGVRTSDVMFWNNELNQEIVKENIGLLKENFHKSGIQIKDKYSIFKILSNEIVDMNNFKWLNMADAVCYELTGEMYTTKSLAIRTGVFDVDTNRYNEILLSKFGLSSDNFAKIIDYVDKNGVRVYNAGHDHLNLLANNLDLPILSTGTTQVLLVEIESQKRDAYYSRGAHIIYESGRIYAMCPIEFSGNRIDIFKQKYLPGYTYHQLNELSIPDENLEIEMDVDYKELDITIKDAKNVDYRLAYCKMLERLADEVSEYLASSNLKKMIVTGGITRNKLYMKYLEEKCAVEIEIEENYKLSMLGAIKKLRRTYE